jgi:FkbH-like protein
MSELSEHIANLSPAKLELLTRRLKEKSRDGQAAQPIPRRDESGALPPLSFAQQQVWVLDQLEPGSSVFNMPAAVRLKGHLDVAALEQAFGEIIRRHESLRTTFALVEEQPRQIIAPAQTFTLPVVELSHLPEEEREAEAHRLTEEEARRGFDLARGPLLRVQLLRLAPEDHALLLTMHHIISDGWSVGVLVKEVKALYNAFTEGRPSPLPELPIQYADFAVWQREWLQGEVLEAQVSYWKEQLANAPALMPLPTDHPRPPVQTLRGAKQPIRISAELADSLRALGQREGVTLFMTLLAALQALLSRCSGQPHAVVVSASANRNRPEVEGLIGYFVNQLVLHTDLSDDPEFRELLKRVRKVCLGAYTHQDLPFDKLLDELKLQRDLSYTPLHQVMFILDVQQDLSIDDGGFAALGASSTGVGRTGTNVDLHLSLRETDQGLVGALEYRTDLFEADTIEYLAASYLNILETAAAQPLIKLSELELTPNLLAKISAAKARDEQQTIAITASFTAEPIIDSLEFWLKQLDLPSRIEFAPYNQVMQQLLDPEGLLAQNRHGANVVLLRLEDWLRDQPSREIEADRAQPVDTQQESAIASEIERNVRDLSLALRSAAERTATPYLLCLCPASPSIAGDTERSALFNRLEEEMRAELEGVPGLSFVDSSEAASLYPVADYYDAHTDEMGHVPFTPLFFASLGTLIARKLHALRRAPYKVIALDCDQTLWKGVCAEDGAQGVEIDAPRRALQSFMAAQHDAGMLLCLCSKNNEEDVLEVFDRHEGMILKRSHLASWRVNWKSKAENIRSLAEELGLGLDSFIFVDNDAVECAQVEAHCPEVLTLELPQEDELIPSFLKHVWAFDHLYVTDEDRRRTSLYQQNLEREKLRQGGLDLEQFIRGLELKVLIAAAAPQHLARAAQLTQRTNQFNTTTKRRTEAELAQLCQSEATRCLVVEVRDRFGDYGLVGLLIFNEQTEDQSLVVETMLLSCRVLGRGVEHQVLRKLGQLAHERALKRIDVLYLPSRRNEPVLRFLEEVAAPYKERDEDGYVFKVPTEVALATSFEPTGRAASDVSPELAQAGANQKTERSPQTARATSAVVRQIAMQLSNAEQILQAVEAQKQKTRSADTTGVYEAPRTPIEEMLANIWARLLNIDRVGTSDNFFKLGGHSLLGTVMFSRVRDTFEVELPLVSLFEAPTVAGLAALIEQQLIEQSDSGQVIEMMSELEHLSEEEIKALLVSEAAELS